MSAAQFVESLFGELPHFFKDEDELRRIWSRPDGSAHEAAAALGGVPVIRDTFVGFQRYLYEA